MKGDSAGKIMREDGKGAMEGCEEKVKRGESEGYEGDYWVIYEEKEIRVMREENEGFDRRLRKVKNGYTGK